MTASKFYAQIQQREQASTKATHKATKQDIRQATGSTKVDWHADKSTDKE
jgi:hypothetical protein